MFCAYEACSVLEIEMAVEMLRGYKSPGADEIAAELIQSGDRTVHLEIRKLVSAMKGICFCTYLYEG
jgi:hypothetical protein